MLDNQSFNYESVCSRYLNHCHTNPQIYALDSMLNDPNPYNIISYPKLKHGTRSYYIASSLGGVTIDKNSGEIESAKAWQLVYPMNVTGLNGRIVCMLMEEIETQLRAYDDDLLSVSIYIYITR